MESNNTKSRQDGRRPLFCLVTTKSADHNIPCTLKGKFAQRDGEIFFFPDKNSDYSAVLLKFWAGWSADITQRLFPLLASLAEEKMPVIITGFFLKKEGIYAVVSLKLDSTSGAFPRDECADSFLDAAIDRLMNADICQAAQPEKKERPLLSNLGEMEMFCKMCKHTFPGWLSKAIQRELEITTNSNGFSDQCKHAKTALQYLINIDWTKKELRVPSIEEAREILDAEFYGLEAVKSRILEIISQINRTGKMPKWGILLNGPAGTGKTSIAKTIARILNELVISIDGSTMGGDPEAISGSPRIYANAQPGHVLKKMFSARSGNGILLINEIDKATDHGKSGKAASADVLLSLLDHQDFYDNFFETAIPTDGLYAIATCNDLDKLSAPLKDRFYVINIPAYTPEEKKIIWSDYVLPRIRASFRLKQGQLTFSEDAVDELIRSYAVEPGARDLEQYAERFGGVLCTMINENGEDYCHTFTMEEVKKLLGPSKRTKRTFAVNPGEINSVFYYEGAAHFFLMEASVTRGSGKFNVFGPVPEIQREYIQVAYECIKNTTCYDLSSKDVSIFVPHAIPASADNHIGCAAYAAIYSLILNTGLEIQDIAFVGGVDLNGNLYFDDSDAAPLLRAVKEANIKTIYAPIGVSEMISTCGNSDCNVTVIEAQNAQHLISIAIAANRVN